MIVIALDPGHTSGWAVLTEEEIVATGMFPDYYGLPLLLKEHAPERAVLEEFVLYPWKSQALAWSQLRTVQTLGVMKYLLDEAGIPYVLQSAATVKQLSKRLLGRYGSQHERDAVVHGIIYLKRQGLATQALTRLIWRRG